MRNVPSLETVYRDFSEKNVQFFYIYKALAHPERDGYVQPVSNEERLAHVKQAKVQLETKMPWICDTMSNDLKHALGDRPNSEFVIDPEGKVLHARAWSDPEQLRKDLTALVGAPENPTAIADLNRKNPGPKKRPAASGVVKRVPRPEGAQALKQVPVIDAEKTTPFYAKLRIEAEIQVTRSGTGTIHVGFYLDPIYDVHWNNLAKPLEFELKTAAGSVTPELSKAAKVEVESDVDPREFLIEAKDLDPSKPLTLTVRYFACNDAEGWCKPVTQVYTIRLERDPDAGRVAAARGDRGDRGGRGRPGGGRGGAQGGGRGGPGRMAEMLKASDQNEDGKITRDEFRGPAERFDRIDANQDGTISKAEVDAMLERFQRRGRPTDEPAKPAAPDDSGEDSKT